MTTTTEDKIMRKITSNAINAFMNNNKFSESNTRVILNDGQTELWLYNTLIARCTDGKYYVTNGGYETNTTKERLNGLLIALDAPKIYQKNFNWFYDRENGERRDFDYDKQDNGFISVDYMKGI